MNGIKRKLRRDAIIYFSSLLLVSSLASCNKGDLDDTMLLAGLALLWPRRAAPAVHSAGYSRNSYGVTVPTYWKNRLPVQFSPIDPMKFSTIRSLALSDDDLFAGGYSTDSSDVRIPGYWKNGVWTPLPQIDPAQDGEVYSMVVSGSDLYAGGFSKNGSGVGLPGYWKNGEWMELTPLYALYYSEVHTMAVSGSDL